MALSAHRIFSIYFGKAQERTAFQNDTILLGSNGKNEGLISILRLAISQFDITC